MMGDVLSGRVASGVGQGVFFTGLGWAREQFAAKLGIDSDKVNVNGGAIALGHPLGCTGSKLTATLLHELKRRGGRYGIVTMCIGGGMGIAMCVERD